MKKKLPTYCFQCYNGPDLFKAVVEDGLVRSIEPNLDCKDISPAEGRVCVKAYGLVQKLYHPGRVQSPLVRTNPKKGRDEDPGWKEISWDEALDMLAGKMNKIRENGLTDEDGMPKFAVIMGQAAAPTAYAGTMPAFFSAWGAIDFPIGTGEGIKCYHSEHLFGELWHRGFISASDTPRTKLVLSFGHNTNASGGVAGVMRHAWARDRGCKRIQVEPHLSISATTSDEWVPIRPKTDAPFMYAMIHAILLEMDWREVCDVPFIEKRTNSPYLVGPGGYYLRDEKSEKPMVWDPVDKSAKTFDDPTIKGYALEGAYKASGIEIGADNKIERYEDAECRPAFQLVLDHMKPYTPEWAAEICDLPVDTIRRIARELVEAACLGETVEISGEQLPFRPVAITLGKTVNNGPGGYQCCWARTLLATLLGALEVPGGTVGASQRLNKPHHDRWSSVWPGKDGFMAYPFNPTDKENWPSEPRSRAMYTELIPLVANTGWSPFLGPVPLAWFSMDPDQKELPRFKPPEVLMVYRGNPGASMYYTDLVLKRLSELPFMVSIGYTLDETNHFADLILPDHTDLEGLQLFRFGPSIHSEAFWKSYGFALRQPAVEPVVNSIDMTDLVTGLAERTGILDLYNEAINAGMLLGLRLKGSGYDYELDPKKSYTKEELWDRLCKASTMILSDGKDEHGLDWFKEHGFYGVDYPQIRYYMHPVMVRWGLRYEFPFQERIRIIGEELEMRLHDKGIHWWDPQLEEYQALPECEDFSKPWDEACVKAGKDPAEFNLWLVNTRSMQYAWGSNAAIPAMAEAAKHVAGFKGALINSTMAAERGIAEGDKIVIESPFGSCVGRAVPRQGVRPDTVVFTGQFGNWNTPFAKDLGIPNLNVLTKPDLGLLDAGGSTADLVKVKIYRKVD